MLCMDSIKNPTGILFSAELKQVLKYYLPYFIDDLGELGGFYDNKTTSFVLPGKEEGTGFNAGRVLFGGANEKSKGNRGGTGHLLGGDELGDWDESFAESVFYPMGDVFDAFMILSGTPRGPNHFKDKFEEFEKKMNEGDKDFFALKWTIEDSLRTGEVTQKQYDRWRKRYSGKDQWVWDVEYMLDFDAAIPGRVFVPFLYQTKKFKRLGNFPPDLTRPVEIFWDLGVNGTVCLFRQRIGGNHFYFKCFRQLEDVNFVKFLSEKVLRYIHETGIKVEKAVFPHDAKWRSDMNSQTRIEMAQNMMKDTVCEALPPFKRMDEAVDKVCRNFSRCFFDVEGCSAFLRDMNLVQFEDGVFIKKGDAKKYTHSADAFVLAESFEENYTGLSFFEKRLDSSSHIKYDSKSIYEKWAHELRNPKSKKKDLGGFDDNPWRF